MQVFDKKTTGMHWQTQKVGRHHQTLEKKNGSSKMEVAVALGGDPALIWSGSAPVPPDINEYLLSGFIRNKGVSVTKGITVDLDIPSEAEFIIEGFVDPNESRKEGPFGDHTGYYSIEDEYPVFHVTAVTHRKNPIYPTIVVGRPPQEDYWLGKATERIFLPIMKLTIPEITDVHMPAEGVFHNLILVSMNREYPGQAQKVAHGLWGLGLMSLTRAIVLLDSDVDLNNPSEVLWRITSNTDPRRDIFFSEGPLDDLDVSSPTGHVGSKIGIDATRKTNESEMGTRKWMPDITMDEDIIEQVTAKWKEYGI
jgi:4-hydroxy-3-polyprenylbenzoate decarboxylase